MLRIAEQPAVVKKTLVWHWENNIHSNKVIYIVTERRNEKKIIIIIRAR